MKDHDQDSVELDMYLEPMVETAIQAEAAAADSETVIICVSHCK